MRKAVLEGWNFNDGLPYGIVGAGDPDVGDEFPLGADAVVSVAEGATLSFGAAQMQIAALAVDVDEGLGTIERFTPAEGGTLYVTTSGDPKSLCQEGPVPLFTVGEILQPRQLHGWTVVVNGVPDPLLCVRWKNGQFVLAPKGGLMLIVK